MAQDDVPRAGHESRDRQNPGTAVPDQYGYENESVDHGALRVTDPAERRERKGEGTPTGRLDIPLDCYVYRRDGIHDDIRGDDAGCRRRQDRDGEQPAANHEAGRARPRNHRKVGDGSQRSGSHRTNADQAIASNTPPRTSLGQWSPAHTLAMHVRMITIAATIHRIARNTGLTLGASANAIMKLTHVKNTA